MLKNLDKAPVVVQPVLETYYQQIIAQFPDKVDSIYLYGSVVTPDFLPEQSDINSLVLFDSFGSLEIRTLSPLIHEGLKKRIVAPLCMSVETFERSADTFPLEFIEIRDKHSWIYGEANRVQTLEIPRENLRLKIEEQIKGKLIRLRQILMEHSGPEKQLMETLVDAQRQLFPVFRNFLRFLGIDSPPLKKDQILHELEARSRVILIPFRRVWEQKSGRASIGRHEIVSVYYEYLDVLLQLAKIIDRLEGK